MSKNIKLIFHTNLDDINTINYNLSNHTKSYIKVEKLMHILKQEFDSKSNKESYYQYLILK